MKNLPRHVASALVATLVFFALPAAAQYQMERLSRGVVAVRTSSSQVYVGWRLFGTDAAGTAFNLYRSSNGGSPMLLNGTPMTQRKPSTTPTIGLKPYTVRHGSASKLLG